MSGIVLAFSCHCDMSEEPTKVFDDTHRMKRRREEGSTCTIDCLDLVTKQI